MGETSLKIRISARNAARPSAEPETPGAPTPAACRRAATTARRALQCHRPRAMQPPPGPPGCHCATMPGPAGPQPTPKKGLAKGAKIAIILAVSAIVLIILAVVLFVVFFANIITAPADVANNYVKAVNAGDLSTAWSYLTTSTQKQETRLGFKSKSVHSKEISANGTPQASTLQTGDVSKIVMSVTFTDGTKTTWDMTLIKVGGKWKIDQVSPRE